MPRWQPRAALCSHITGVNEPHPKWEWQFVTLVSNLGSKPLLRTPHDNFSISCCMRAGVCRMCGGTDAFLERAAGPVCAALPAVILNSQEAGAEHVSRKGLKSSESPWPMVSSASRAWQHSANPPMHARTHHACRSQQHTGSTMYASPPYTLNSGVYASKPVLQGRPMHWLRTARCYSGLPACRARRHAARTGLPSRPGRAG